MTPTRVLLMAFAIALAATRLQGQSTSGQSPLVGTWLLENIVDTLPDGSVSYWMGRHPTGAIVYSASGHMSVQFMRDPRPALPAREAVVAEAQRLSGGRPLDSLSRDQFRDMVLGYYAYFGRYQVSAKLDSVVHFVETSLRPDEVGTIYRRAIRIEGDHLFISLSPVEKGVPRHRVLTWRRGV